jgi:hypothetical protein
MKAGAEVYKGIEFVRLSSLKDDQSLSIRNSAFAGRTIKILRNNEIISDCLPYTVYLEWYHQFVNSEVKSSEREFVQEINRLKFALK